MDRCSHDILTPEARSKLMSKVSARNTGPEKKLRSLLHRAGFRFRLHAKRLPGKPDIVLPRYRTVIFVHGCFWHGHTCAKGTNRPKTRPEFWEKKINGNQERDGRNRQELENLGWRVLTVWECELKNQEELMTRLRKYFGSSTV